MTVLVAVGRPHSTTARRLIAERLALDNIAIANTGGVYINLTAIVVVRFKGFEGHVLAAGKGDLRFSNEVLAELLRHGLVRYSNSLSFNERPETAVPMVEIRIPELTEEDQLTKWATSIGDGVRRFLNKVNQVK